MKRYIVILLITCAIHPQLIAQKDTCTYHPSPLFKISYTGDLANNISGGIRNGNFYLGMANIEMLFQTEQAGLWKGGQLFINASNTHGDSPSMNMLGDIQIASNIDVGERTLLHECWVKQDFNHVSITLGLQDLNTEFITSECAGLYINSSFGTHSSIANSLPLPITPLTSLSLQVKYSVTASLSIKTAIFDGLPDDMEKNDHNLQWKLSKDDGFLSFSEISLSPTISEKDGNYKLGCYFHNSYKTQRDSESVSQSHPANYGIYFIADQIIYKHPMGKTLSLFAQASLCPNDLNENWYYLGLGLNFSNFSSKHKCDVLGLAIAHAGMQKSNCETVFELTYKAKLNKWITIQPDIQYIINPAGTAKHIEDAVLAMLRFKIAI